METVKQKRTKNKDAEKAIIDLANLTDAQKKILAKELGIDYQTYSVRKPIMGTWVSEKTGTQYFTYTPWNDATKKHERRALFFTIDSYNEFIDNLDEFADYITNNIE